MTEKQNKTYWRKWGEVRRVLTTLGEFSPKDADAQRKEIQREAIGLEKSSKDLTDKEIDKVFDAFDNILVIMKGPRDGDRSNQPCKRLIYAIEQLGLDEPYLAKIALDQFKVENWRTLTEPQLSRFRFTCTKRANSKKGAANRPNSH